MTLRACRALVIDTADVARDFPVAFADHLRAGGIELTVDDERVAARRRVKTGAQLAGIRRAQRAADAAMARAARAAAPAAADGAGSCSTAASPASAMQGGHRRRVPRARRELSDDVIVAHGPQSARGHDIGSGAVEPASRW